MNGTQKASNNATPDSRRSLKRIAHYFAKKKLKTREKNADFSSREETEKNRKNWREREGERERKGGRKRDFRDCFHAFLLATTTAEDETHNTHDKTKHKM